MKRSFLLFLVSVILLASASGMGRWYNHSTSNAKKELVRLMADPSDTLQISAVGDMMLGTNFPSSSYLAPDDGRFLLSPVTAFLQQADIAFGNCEGAFLDEGGTVKKCQDSTKCYAFRQPTRYAQYLADAGFDLVSVANNHLGDFGQEGRESSIMTLQKAGLACAGQLTCPTTVIERDGVRYGLAAFAPNSGCVDLRDIPNAVKIVTELCTRCDVCIVSFHGGAEGATNCHVTRKTEQYVGEDRGNIYAFSHAMIDAGADVLLGHGPHVTRAVELYKDRLIAYSLGNFCTYARFNLDGPAGMSPLLNVFVDKSGRFLEGSVIAVKQIGEGGPLVDEDRKVIAELTELSSTDFPESPLVITPDGRISRK